jgi:hypothetical protein
MRGSLLCSLVLSTFALRAQDAPPVAAPFDLDAAFAKAQPPIEEARWTLIPWRHSLTDALAEAKRTKRPIYLFVNDGDVDSGRC